MADLKPSSKGTPDVDLRYDPTSMTMKHDSVFAEAAPAVVSSGNLAHKWYPEGDQTCSAEPPSNLKGD